MNKLFLVVATAIVLISCASEEKFKITGTTPDINNGTNVFLQKIDANNQLQNVDTTVIKEPTVEEVVQITRLLADNIRRINMVPRIALLGYSNFGSNQSDKLSQTMSKATEILHRENPDLVVDGELQANFALDRELLKENFPFR